LSQSSNRRWTLITVNACQRPPAGVAAPRAFSSAAIALADRWDNSAREVEHERVGLGGAQRGGELRPAIERIAPFARLDFGEGLGESEALSFREALEQGGLRLKP
jgi:hypothetical protein